MKFQMNNNSLEEVNDGMIFGPLVNLGTSMLKDHAEEATKEIVYGIILGARDILVDSIGAVTLVGTGLLIILKMAGYKDGYRYSGVLFVVNILVKYLLGGI